MSSRSAQVAKALMLFRHTMWRWAERGYTTEEAMKVIKARIEGNKLLSHNYKTYCYCENCVRGRRIGSIMEKL